MSRTLGDSERDELLRLARRTLETYLPHRKFTPIETTLPALKQKRGVFVSLHAQHVLRGCIGHLAADRPLYLVTQEMAIEAATGDPRFPPLTADELPQIQIEISVLSPFQKVSGPAEIRVGEHGLLVSRGLQRGLLLPQVATVEAWDAETFLDHTCRKAGMEPNAWRAGNAEIFMFRAEVFSEPSPTTASPPSRGRR